MSGKDTPVYNLKKLKTPTLKRLAKEHIALHDLCSKSNKLFYKVVKERSGVPETYHITYKVRSIIAIDGDQNPVFGNEHVAELALPPNYPVEPAKCYMITDTWHPNIKSEGVHKGHICTNSNELGKLMDLYMLVHRIGKILQFQNYHAENVYPYPDDEKVARWVREYAEPNDIINKDKHIFVDDRELLTLSDEKPKENTVRKVITSVVEENTKQPEPEPEPEPPIIKSKFKITPKLKIKDKRDRPSPDGKIRINRRS